jgi:hypothetical protein
MKVFLDMDGVLANLFDKVAQEIHHKPYKNINAEEKAEAKKIWSNKKDAANFFNQLGGVEHFFATLPTFGDKTQAVVDTAIKVAGEYRICSHPASIDREASKKGKITWINKHLSPQPIEMFFPQNKADYAINQDGSPNILVDDFPPYINAWRNVGGIAIEMRTDNFNSARDVRTFLEKQLMVAAKSSTKESFDVVIQQLQNQFNLV